MSLLYSNRKIGCIRSKRWFSYAATISITDSKWDHAIFRTEPHTKQRYKGYFFHFFLSTFSYSDSSFACSLLILSFFSSYHSMKMSKLFFFFLLRSPCILSPYIYGSVYPGTHHGYEFPRKNEANYFSGLAQINPNLLIF